MLGNIPASDVRQKIEEGDEKCKRDQKIIASKAMGKANAERLVARQAWAANKKKLKALLDVLELDTE